MSSNLIDIRNLSWSYPKSKTALFDGFSFSFGEKDFRILQGKSGCGKTTLVKMLTGYIVPPKKSVFFASDDLSRLTSKERQDYRRRVGIVFQENKLLNDISVKDNVCYPLLIYGLKQSEIDARYDAVMKQVGLSDKCASHIRFLSGGEKQKVAIARALIHEPDFVIADEPTGNLDRESSKNTADLFVKIHKEGTSVLFITHNDKLVDYLEHRTELKVTTL